MTTPRFTVHARQRCVEMGLTTKQVKHLFRTTQTDYPGPHQHSPCRLRVVGDLAIAYQPGDPPTIVTVLYHGTEFVRPA